MLDIKRINKKFQPDYSRVIVKPHIPQEEVRRKKIIMRVLNLSEEKVNQVLEKVIISFSNRHKNIWESFEKNYNDWWRFCRTCNS